MPHGTVDIQGEFRASSEALLTDIRALGDRLKNAELEIRKDTIGLITKDQERGQHYEAHILEYLRRLRDLKKQHLQDVQQLAGRITTSIGSAREALNMQEAEDYRADTWLALATALAPLGQRPSKKFAAMLIDDRDRLVSWDVNHLAPGFEEKERADLYSKAGPGGRGNHILCAEINAIASFLGKKARSPLLSSTRALDSAARGFKRRLANAALSSAELKQFTLVSSHCPCSICASVLVPKRRDERKATVREIITTWDDVSEKDFTSPERQTTEALKAYEEAGLPIRIRRNGQDIRPGR